MRSLLFLITLTFSVFAKADSPLTSTPFSNAYAKEKMVMYIQAKGLDDKAFAYLCNKKGDAVVKIAMINQLSWGNKDYVKQFENYLVENRKIKPKTFEYLRGLEAGKASENKFTKKLTADELMCWSYFNALGDYFHPNFAVGASELAIARESKSMAHAAVYTLISCQIAFDVSWCDVYKIGQKYLVETTYSENIISTEGVQIILDYLNLYQGDCK